MQALKKHWILLVLISFSLGIHAQTQIGSDIDGLLADDRFGTGVSLSADGTIVAIVGYSGNNGPDRVRVFKNIGGVWTLYGTDSNGDNFGGMLAFSCSLSADGNTLAVSVGFTAVRVFRYDTETGFWSQKGNDIPNNTSESEFGYSIKLSSDGNTIVIGAVTSPIVPIAGVTQIFQYETDSWNQEGGDINGIGFTEHSGRSVDISSNGKIVAISNDNSARVYENISGVWTLLGNEIPALGSQYPNRAISLSSDGAILAIGEPDYTDSLIQRGRVSVYIYDSDTWEQIGGDILGEVAYYRTGVSVSLSSDGQVLAIGEPGSTSNSTDKGRTRIFENQGGTWTQLGIDIFGEASEDYSGGNISLSSDANTVAIGADLNDGNGVVDSGHVRVYDLSATLSVNNFKETKIRLFPNPAKEQFTIQLNEGFELKNVTIYSSLGELVISINNRIINTSKLSKGIYYVEINTNKGITTKKIVIF